MRKDGGGARLVLDDGTQIAAPLNAGGNDGQTVVLEPTGADTLVACRHGSTEMAAVFRERHDFAPGSTIRLMPDLARAHLFDAASGERLAA